MSGGATVWSYARARSREDALDAAECVRGWLKYLAGMDLGHDGDHAVAEALKNLRAVTAFIRRPERSEA